MRTRMALVAVILGAVVGAASLAQAARIDPELQRILDAHEKSEIIPVLMIYGASPLQELDDLEVEIDYATPGKRRDAALAALKKYARKIQTDAWDIIENPGHPGTLVYAHMLYFADAIAFAGDADLIMAVASAKSADDAILYYDKDYDLLSGVSQRVSMPGGEKSADSDTSWNVQYIHADRVWGELGFTGEGIVVGHLDTGVWLTHPDLIHRLWDNPGEIPGNGIDDDQNGYIDDVHGWDFGDNDNDPNDDGANAGHGTHTAGTLAGDGSGGIRTGVAPGATIMVCKIFKSDGSGTLSSIWAGQQYCVEEGARIITMSVGIRGEIPDSFLRNDRYNALGIRAAGVTVFNSAGNDHGVFMPPIELSMSARIPSPWQPTVPYSSSGGIITVGGTGYHTDAPFDGSSRGPADWGGIAPWYDWPYDQGQGLIKPDISAPAVGINSTFPPNSYSGETWVGTSMACPQAAGVAALMLQKNPTLSPAGIDSTMEQSARHVNGDPKNEIYGAGVLDAYAAVEAVSLDQMPDLQEAAVATDPTGNSVLDPGEIEPLVFTIANTGQVTATGVVGRLRVVANPFVVADTTYGGRQSVFPDIVPGAEASNAATPFRLVISPAAPQGYSVTLLLTMTTAESFERTVDCVVNVGLPDLRTHDAGGVYMTVTDRGSLGYLDDSRMQGDGMGVVGQPSSLFLSSLWGGNSAAYVCNNDLTADGHDPVEWQTRLSPTGRVAVTGGPPATQAFAAAFTDSGHATPRGIEIRQYSWQYSDAPYDDAIVVQYVITNGGSDTILDYFAGLFADFDVMDSLADVGGTDPNRRAVWIGTPGGACFGVAALGPAPVSNLSLIDNVTYIYPHSYMDDGDKMAFLNGNHHQAQSDQETDWSCIAARGPFTLPPGGQVVVAFALVYGADQAALLANVDRAQELYTPIVAVSDGELTPGAVRLQQNLPNPFNPATEIRFSVPTSGPVDLAVFDVSGRRVRTLVTGSLAAGDHTTRWDGRDDAGNQVPSGMYLYRVIAAGETLTRKMMLLK